MLICWGTDDTWIPVDRAHRLAGMIPGAGLRLIEGAGHLVQEDEPAALTADLLDFLTRLSGTAGRPIVPAAARPVPARAAFTRPEARTSYRKFLGDGRRS